MFCPKCEREVSDEHIFCPKCGSDLQLVPEYKLDEDLLSELQKEERRESRVSRPKDNAKAKPKNGKKSKKIDKNKLLLAQIIGLTVLIIVAVTGVIVFFSGQNKKNSDKYQIEQAKECFAKKNYTDALDFYKKAYEINSENVDVVYGMAECYMKMGDEESAVLYYLEAAEADAKNEKAFKVLLEIYSKAKDQEAIRELYGVAQSQSIRDLFAGYMTAEPMFSMEEGTYNQLTEVTITLAEKGTIYYTLDGSTPTEESTKYQNPIQLEEGKTVIHAIAVTKTGQVSKEIVKTYEIILETPKAPGITPDSGKYSAPTRIEVAVEEGSTVYYTIDGSVPNENSRSCKHSFPMPLGNNIVSVLYIDKNGKTSEVTKKNYNLTVAMDVTEDVALQAVKNAMLQKGEIENMDGYKNGSDGLLVFNTLCVEEILGEKYYIVEKHKNLFSGEKKFVSYYAYNVSTGKIYNATLDDSDSFKLSAF